MALSCCAPRGASRPHAPSSRGARASATLPVAPPSATGGAVGQKAVVVGAGVGGLAMAGRLSRAGYAVTLLEKNPGVGGRMQSHNPPGASEWRFDTGPSLLLFPDKYRECFEALGERMEDHVQLQRVRARLVAR